MAEELLRSPSSLLLLAASRSGPRVLPQALAQVPEEVSKRALRQIRCFDVELQATKHGGRILELLSHTQGSSASLVKSRVERLQLAGCVA
mmetsp:Transcript_32950/g.103198  ORF Transcript_32950/g.103198 Transcript_32950/m.103198 type:complete len:90 (+) Transcript_32950:407-676(+)